MDNSKTEVLKQRTKQFAIDIINNYKMLSTSEEGRLIGRQLLRSASSMAANYRAACRARSKAEFYAKLSIVVEESDECVFWLEILAEADIPNAKKIHLNKFSAEALELLKIFSASRKTAKINLNSTNQ
jgi:four helix bundle protein